MPHACLPATAARRCHLTPPHALHGHVVEWRRRRLPSLMPLPLALSDEHLRPRQAALRVGDGPPPGLSLEHGPDDARACRRSQRRRIVQGRRSRSGVGLAGGGLFAVPTNRLDAHVETDLSADHAKWRSFAL